MTRHEGKEREMPNAHVYHIIFPIVFMTIWFLDSNVFKFTVWLNDWISIWLRIIFFIFFLVLAFTFINLSHKILFQQKHEPSDKLITKGILGHVRNPMYLGILLIYIAFLFLSISITCIALFFPIFLVYNKMANFEEKILEDLFGEEYLEHKKKVPKWIPKLSKRK